MRVRLYWGDTPIFIRVASLDSYSNRILQFNKWIEAIPTRKDNDSIIISFLENNILSRFGCPMKIITNYAQAFKSKKMINFYHQYHITLGHSTAYYLQGNGLVESSNKSIV